MPLVIQFTCDRAHPHADGATDGVACEHSRAADFDHSSETCEDLFRCFRHAGWYVSTKEEGGGKPDIVLCPAHAKHAAVHGLLGVPLRELLEQQTPSAPTR